MAEESKALAFLFWLFRRKLYVCRKCGAAFHLPRARHDDVTR